MQSTRPSAVSKVILRYYHSERVRYLPLCVSLAGCAAVFLAFKKRKKDAERKKKDIKNRKKGKTGEDRMGGQKS